MGLNLRGTPTVSSRTRERVQKTVDIMDEVRAQMAQMGLQPYPRPKNTPEPLDETTLDGLSNQELERYLTSYTGYAAYLQTKVVEATIAHKASVINTKAVKANLKASLYKDRVPKSEVDARVNIAPEFIARELEELKLYAVEQILDAHYNAYSKQAGAVSRVIELRKLDFEQQHRQNNVQGYRPGLPKFQRRL